MYIALLLLITSTLHRKHQHIHVIIYGANSLNLGHLFGKAYFAYQPISKNRCVTEQNENQ